MKALFIFLLPLVLTSCFTPDLIKQEQMLFETTVAPSEQIKRHLLIVGDNTLFYATSGDSAKPSLIIIHGTPGDWQQYARYLLNESLLQYFHVVLIDRPGWGQSHLGDNKEIASFSEQANIIAALAKKLKQESNNQPVILMGHSLGASLSPKVAIDYPNDVDGLLLLAGTLSPELSSPRWFNEAAKWSIVQSIVGERMAKSNLEILALKNETMAMSVDWQKIKAHVLVVQGMKDKLVYPANIDYAEKYLPFALTEVIRLEDDGHLFPMTRREDIVSWATCLLEKIEDVKESCLLPE